MITREKMKHILEYAKQHRHVGLHCKVPPADMVEIVELALQSGNSAQPVTVPDELIHHDKDPEVTKAYKIGFNACLAVVKSATVTVPAGYVLVPAEPTTNQWAAGMQAFDYGMDKVTRVYKAMLAAAPKAPDGWIPVSERMPEWKSDYRYIPLNLLLNGRTVVQGGFDDGRFWLDGVRISNVTAWQPLPDAPKGV